MMEKKTIFHIERNTMTKTVLLNAIFDLAASAEERQEMVDFGIDDIVGDEIQAIMEEELAARRREVTRRAVGEIISLNEIAQDILRQQFETIRRSNRAIAEAREYANKIALARAYGAETRNYIPLAMLLRGNNSTTINMGSVSTATEANTAPHIVPDEWLKKNAEKVLTAFKEQGKVKKPPVKKQI